MTIRIGSGTAIPFTDMDQICAAAERYRQRPRQVRAVDSVLACFPEPKLRAGRAFDAQELDLDKGAQGCRSRFGPAVVRRGGQGHKNQVASVVISQVGVVGRALGQVEDEPGVSTNIAVVLKNERSAVGSRSGALSQVIGSERGVGSEGYK